MTRISADTISENEISERSERRPRRRKHRRGSGCCIFFIVVLLFGVLTSCAVVAKSGIIEVPFFSDVFYRVPKPTRIVEVDADANQELAVVANPLSGTATLTISEEQLTQALRRSLGGYDTVAISTAQAVILPEGIELFGLVTEPVRVTIIVLIEPRIENAHLFITVKKLTLGNLPLPPSWAERITRWLAGGIIDQTAQAINSVAIEQIELHDKTVRVVVPLSSALLRTGLPSNGNPANFLK